MMSDDMKYVSCPVCGKLLFKVSGRCKVEVICKKCRKKIVGEIDERHVHIFEESQEDSPEEKVE